MHRRTNQLDIMLYSQTHGTVHKNRLWCACIHAHTPTPVDHVTVAMMMCEPTHGTRWSPPRITPEPLSIPSFHSVWLQRAGLCWDSHYCDLQLGNMSWELSHRKWNPGNIQHSTVALTAGIRIQPMASLHGQSNIHPLHWKVHLRVSITSRLRVHCTVGIIPSRLHTAKPSITPPAPPSTVSRSIFPIPLPATLPVYPSVANSHSLSLLSIACTELSFSESTRTAQVK